MSHLRSISLLEEKILHLESSIRAIQSVEGDSKRVLKLKTEVADYRHTLEHLNEIEHVREIVF